MRKFGTIYALYTVTDLRYRLAPILYVLFDICVCGMSDSRSNPRSKVSWRAAILLAPGNIVAAKILDFTMAGVQLQCGHVLKEGQTYQMMMEVPSKRDASQRTQVVCKATVRYNILSGNEYRSGMKYFDFAPEHLLLLQSWAGAPVTME